MKQPTIEAKNAAISAQIVKLLAGGASVRDAVDAVLGAGTHERLAAEVYDALRVTRAVAQ